ncbi:hypothetical protein B5807_01903 [Epicoccum nigrum]|uniref:Uncharacterized protein n=1 Tax=Epicoccum nigrum TaxID=105696 RepID=A0A1Y2MBT7_EPING|nr:hypothetical protein B5807_01903 [Epicoccum nigrum]
MVPPKLVINEPSPIHGGRNDQSSKPPIIGITQSTSQPADPDAPSFLTTLPAEIRNAIYKILFTRAGPIEIYDKADQREYPSWIENSDFFDEEAELEAASYMRRKTRLRPRNQPSKDLSTDQLQLRRYSRHERLIESIDINIYNDTRDAGGKPENMVYYGGSSEDDAKVRINIDEADGNFTLSLDPALSYKGLPWKVHQRIAEYVLSPCKQLEFDLQSHTVTGLERSVIQLDRRYRSFAQALLARSHRFTLSMETSETKTSFNNFAKLREWWRGPYGKLFATRIDDPPGHKILLNFNAPNTSLASLRINVVSFIRLTYFMNKNTTVRIISRSAGASICADEAYEIKLQTLRRRCFVLLSAMLLHKPTRASLPAPDIWIDGTGIPIEVAWSVPKAGRLRRGSDFPLDAAALCETGADYIAEITSTQKTDSWPRAAVLNCGIRCDSLKTNTSLMSMWLSLRAFDWIVDRPKSKS